MSNAAMTASTISLSERSRMTIALAVLGSMLLHVALFSLWSFLPSSQIIPSVPKKFEKPFSFSLEAYSSQVREASSGGELDEGNEIPANVPSEAEAQADDKLDAARRVTRTVPPSAQKVEASPVISTIGELDLSLPEIESAPAIDGTKGDGDRIFDRRLSDRLSQLRQRLRRRSRDQSFAVPYGEQEVIGGQVDNFVQIGDLCFNVLEADPLEPISLDHWFPVACPD